MRPAPVRVAHWVCEGLVMMIIVHNNKNKMVECNYSTRFMCSGCASRDKR